MINFVFRGDIFMYKCEIDFMDKSQFPIKSEYKCKKNPTKGLPQSFEKKNLTNEEIISTVSKMMIDSLGESLDV